MIGRLEGKRGDIKSEGTQRGNDDLLRARDRGGEKNDRGRTGERDHFLFGISIQVMCLRKAGFSSSHEFFKLKCQSSLIQSHQYFHLPPRAQCQEGQLVKRTEGAKVPLYLC